MTNTCSTIQGLGFCTTAALGAVAFAGDALADPSRDSPDGSAVATTTPEPLGTRGQWMLAAEDLFRVTRTFSGYNYETVGGGESSTEHASLDTAYAQFLWPAVAADWFPIPRLGVGLSARYEFFGDSSRYEAEGVQQIDMRSHRLSFTPRVGYALPLVNDFGLWGRVGASNRIRFERYFSTADFAEDTRSTQTHYELGLEGSVLGTYSPGKFLTVFSGLGVEKPLWWSFESEPYPPMQTSDDDEIALFFTIGAGARL